LTDPVSVRRANTATFATTAQSERIARPTSVEEVVRLVRFASARQLKIYTVSRGRNWGFGSRVPVVPSAMLLDLSRMNRILHYDPYHGTLRVEPGVSFAEASRFLTEAGNQHFIGAIGGSPDASVLGNVLERGDGAGLPCERASHACAFEVVLADGTIVDTGYANRTGSKVSDIARDGVGPGVQDLFLQSNLGVVTKMTLVLQRRPASFRSYWFRLMEHGDLATALNELRLLMQRRVVSGPVVFWNDYKQTAAAAQYPWSATGGRTPLDRAALRRISNAYCAWLGFGGIYVDHPLMAAVSEREIRRSLRRGLGKPLAFSSLSSHKIAFLRWLDRLPCARFDHSTLLRQWDANPLLGGVSDKGVRALYWRKRYAAPDRPDPERDGCGVLWNAFEAPLEGEGASALMEQLDERVLSHGFEPMVSLAVVSEHRVKCFLQLVYDREVDGDDDRAWACHADVFEFLEDRGFTHSRVDTRHMSSMRARARTTVLRDRIARALDPASVLSPGRYEF
jgi:4-cresol dehydrogenase (hydroxylating)